MVTLGREIRAYWHTVRWSRYWERPDHLELAAMVMQYTALTPKPPTTDGYPGERAPDLVRRMMMLVVLR